MTSIFNERVLDSLASNSTKPAEPVPDNSIHQFSETITDKELNEHIKRMERLKNN